MIYYKKIIALLLSVILITNITACSNEKTADLNNTSEEQASPDLSDTSEPQSTPDLSSEPIDENNFGKFTAQTLKGDNISDDVFADYDVTMVNIWATWCSPCVQEMPYLQELYSMLPENANLVTICSDATTQEELANEILADSNAEFETIVANDEVNAVVLSRIQAFPTSVFVDSQGTVLHVIQGVPNGDVASLYLEVIDLILEVVNSNVE